MKGPEQLHEYQRHAIQHALDNPACGLFLEMGLGKTISTLTVIQELMFDRFETRKTLVIAPKRVAAYTWGAEIREWTHTCHLRTSKIMGTPQERIAAIKRPADIYLINRENLAWLIEHLDKGKAWDYDLVILDELSSFKNAGSKRFRALRKVRGKISRIIGLTGTPAPNGLLDLWPQIYLLDQGQRLGQTITGYRSQYFTPAAMMGMIVTKYALKKGADQEIHNKIADICISMKAEDYLELQGRIDLIHPVYLNQALAERYTAFEEDAVMQIEDQEITAVNAAAMTTKLLQFCSGAAYSQEGRWAWIHDEKLDALEDLYEAAVGNPVLVLYQYKHEAERIAARFPKAKLGLDSQADLDKWNRGEIEMLVVHPASVGHGLNLQQGGHQLIWFTLPWSLELYTQAVARLDRQGQTRMVTNTILATKDTVEADVALALTNKARTQAKLMEAVKARIKAVQRKIGRRETA